MFLVFAENRENQPQDEQNTSKSEIETNSDQDYKIVGNSQRPAKNEEQNHAGYEL